MPDREPHKELYVLLVARSDLTSALNTARYIIQHVNDLHDELWAPLQDAALIAYARPFTQNRPYGPLPDKYGIYSSAHLQHLHDEILILRNKVIAHSDADVRRITVVPPGLTFGPVTSGSGGGVAVSTQKLPPQRFTEIEELCLDVGRRVNADANELTMNLMEEELPQFPFDLMTNEPIA